MEILGVRVDTTDLNRASNQILEWIRLKKNAYVCIAPVSTIISAQKDKNYLNVINNAGMVTPDGMPLVWLGKMKGFKLERTYGPDLMLKVCEQGISQGLKHYFYGGYENTNKKLVLKLKEKFPNVEIAGIYTPGMLENNTIEKSEVIDKINKSNADILWVGLGSPKQDFWMANHRSKLEVPVMIGVGAAFDFIAGVKKQAPKWMRQRGLEWFFRLCQEPKRLWKRYLVGNSLFIYLILKDSFVQLFKNKK